MRHVDFSPLYRSTVGFDRLFSLLDNMGQPEQSSPSYPPYNIERTGENQYRITMAVAGFGENDLEIEAKENTLLVTGNQEKVDEDSTEMLFRGIAARNFERRFQLADHVEVRSAHMQNGLLHIELVREIPEAMKARKIAIAGEGVKTNGSKSKAKQLEAKVAS
ncbi:MAG: Hsp20 family protein [Pseudomonadota bacterium]